MKRPTRLSLAALMGAVFLLHALAGTMCACFAAPSSDQARDSSCAADAAGRLASDAKPAAPGCCPPGASTAGRGACEASFHTYLAANSQNVVASGALRPDDRDDAPVPAAIPPPNPSSRTSIVTGVYNGLKPQSLAFLVGPSASPRGPPLA